MAQRGGSVFSHLRMGEGIHSPMIARGEADLLLGFEPGEAARMLPFLRPGGQVIVSSRPVTPVMAALSGETYRAEPMLDYLKEQLKDVRLGDTEGLEEKVRPVLSNATIFGVNLYEAGLADRVVGYLAEMLAGPGAVKATLEKYI